jgi:Protein of unknown function (DUF3014)
MADEMFDRPATNKRLIGGVIAAIVIVAAVWFLWFGHRGPMPIVPESTPPVLPAPEAEERIEHPVPAAPSTATKAPLPELNDSDQPFAAALGVAAPDAPLAQYLVPEGIIRHLVVTVDNLPRQKVAVDKRPVIPTAGAFIVQGDELHATLDSRNYQRYRPMVDMIRKADMQRVADVYLRFYPLFQKSYQDLGYPTGYFNDRLVKSIDLLLATPQVTGPVELVRPNVMYLFADPALEKLAAGQKVLIRMGPDNAAAVKAKLMELRAIITTAPPKH